jgi:hypothetical protein
MSNPILPPNSPSVWDANGVNSTAPDAGHLNDGYVVDEVPSSSVWNWLFNNFSAWLTWFQFRFPLMLGGSAQTAIILSAGNNQITPANSNISFGSGTGTVTDILPTNFKPGSGSSFGTLVIQGGGGGTGILAHGIGTTCPIYLATQSNVVVANSQDFVVLQLNNAGNAWYEVSRSVSLGGIGKETFQARLTGTTGVAVSPTDNNNIANLYLTPYKGNTISLFNGTNWQAFNLSADLSLAVPATTLTVYDVFVSQTGGVLSLNAIAWGATNSRSTPLAMQNGIYVNSANTSQRYVGSFMTGGTSGQTKDSRAFRYIWNYYNRIRRAMEFHEATATWSYSSQTIRNSNNDANAQLDFVVGVMEDEILIRAFGCCSSTSATGIGFQTSIAINGVNISGSTTFGLTPNVTATETTPAQAQASFLLDANSIVAGRTTAAWTEANGQSSGTLTWYGNQNSGIFGELLA